jgi:hypothetical protein
MSPKFEKPKPIVLKNDEGATLYTLDFTRETVKWAEQRGFKISEVLDFPETGIKTLFFYSFRANHRGMNSVETDKLFDDLRVDRKLLIGRLVDLYQGTIESLTDDTSDNKNFKTVVEL